MKKRITILACLMVALVWAETHSQQTSANFWPEEYGACIASNFSAGGACYSTRWGAEDACDSLPPSQIAACKQSAKDDWWTCESDANGIFGNCTSQVNFDYNELDFCAHSNSVYNDCLATYQCNDIEDLDERLICSEARAICVADSGIDRCR